MNAALFDTQGSPIAAKQWDGPTRKQCTDKDYQANSKAFEFLKRDLAEFANYAGIHLYPVLFPENYGIDVGIYTSEAAYKAGKAPIALVELEIKEARCCPSWNAPNAFPKWPTINFLVRKMHLVFQQSMPFWVCYNFNGTDCMTFSMVELLGLPVAKNSSDIKDPIIPIPKKLVTFGRENITKVIDRTMAAYHGYESPFAVQKPVEEAFDHANRVYQKVFRADNLAIIDARNGLVRKMQRGERIEGISEFI